MDKKSVVWPAYLDASKSRKEGRRIPKNHAMDSPSPKNIRDAAQALALNPELEKDKNYPKEPYGKKGRVLVDRKGSKNATLKAIAREIRKKR